MEKETIINHILKNAIINSGQDLSTTLHGLSKGEIGVLGYLSFIENNVSAKVLSENLKISSARVAKLLNTLENKSYIIRIKDKNDKRKIVVMITEDGSSLIHKMRNRLHDTISYIIDELGMEEVLHYLNTTQKIKEMISNQEGDISCFK